MLTGIIVALVASLIIAGIKAIARSGQPKNNITPIQPNFPNQQNYPNFPAQSNFSNQPNYPNQQNYPVVYEIPFGVPALPMYISKNNQQLGPFPPEQVLSMLNGGQISVSDLGIRQGDSQWQPLSSYFTRRLH